MTSRLPRRVLRRGHRHFLRGAQAGGFRGETSFDQSLIVTEAMLAQTMRVMSPARPDDPDTSLPCNRSDLEYPDYAEQCATLTATSPSVASVHQAFWLAYRALRSRLTNCKPVRVSRPETASGLTWSGERPGPAARFPGPGPGRARPADPHRHGHRLAVLRVAPGLGSFAPTSAWRAAATASADR